MQLRLLELDSITFNRWSATIIVIQKMYFFVNRCLHVAIYVITRYQY